MDGGLDLDVDTSWIRRAAASLADTADGFRSVAGWDGGRPVADGALGPSTAAASVVALVNQRTAEAADAAVQLGSISAGLANGLTATATAFDRSEVAISRWHP